MTSRARDILTEHMLVVRVDDPADRVCAAMLAARAPAVVTDARGRALGVITALDLTTRRGAAARELMSAPPTCIDVDATLDEMARVLVETGRRQLVAVGADGRAAGLISAVALVREMARARLAALPAPLGDARANGRDAPPIWSGATALEARHLQSAPRGPGVMVLLRGAVMSPDHVLWVEAVNNVHARLVDLLEASEPDEHTSARLHYCVATVARADRCEALAAEIRAAAFRAPGPLDLMRSRGFELPLSACERCAPASAPIGVAPLRRARRRSSVRRVARVRHAAASASARPGAIS